MPGRVKSLGACCFVCLLAPDGAGGWQVGGLVHPLPASLSPSVVGVFGWRRRAGTAVKHCGVSSVARPPLLLPHPLRPSGFGAGFRSPLSFRRALCRHARSTLAVQSPQSANAAKILCAFSRAVCGLLLSIIAGDHLAMRSPLGVCVGWVLISLDFPHVALVWAGCHTQLPPSPIPFGLTWCHH